MGLEDDALVLGLEKMGMKESADSVLDSSDPAFLVPPEFRPKMKHDEFFESKTDQIPIVDLSAVGTNDEEGIRKVIEEIGKAAEEWGFFQVINHGVPASVIDTLNAEALAFFSLSVEEKNEIVRTLDHPLGYYNSELTKNQRDWKEVFDFLVRDAVMFSDDEGRPSYSLQTLWPRNPPGLRDACQKYATATEGLAVQLLKLLAQSLGLPADQFLKHFENHTSSIRLNYYPVCPIPDRILGVSRHKDPGAVTILLQDETGGLQVRRKNGDWIGVRPRRDAFVINLGDLFQVWSNDKYRSVEHRALVNENKARLSIPFFYNPDASADIFPVPELLDEIKPPRYSHYRYGCFMKKRVDGNYHQDGEDIQIEHFAINRS